MSIVKYLGFEPLSVTASLTALLGNMVSGQVALSRSLWRCVIVIIDKQVLVRV